MDSGRLELPPGPLHLDTVRALHQTVVSLHTALEISKNELKELREKFLRHSCSNHTDVIEKLTLENHILRRRIIDTGGDTVEQNLQLKVTYSPREDRYENNVQKKSSTPDINRDQVEGEENISTQSKTKDIEDPALTESEEINEDTDPQETNDDQSLGDSENPRESHPEETFKESDNYGSGFKTKLELLSKFDVKIKVRTLKEGVITSTSSETDSTNEDKDSTAKENVESEENIQLVKENIEKEVKFTTATSDNIKMAVPSEENKNKRDQFDVQVRITSEENLVVKDCSDITKKRKETLNLDVDDLSYRSLSEGCDSVFSGGGSPETEGGGEGGEGGGEGRGSDDSEVDDIELIFTADESKDMSNLQEDLVPITDSDQWATSPTTHSTPVLIKFHTLDPDFQPGAGETATARDAALKTKRISLPNDKCVKTLDLPKGILKSAVNRSDNALYARGSAGRRLDSVDSLAGEYRRHCSLDTKSSSIELGSSMDMLQSTDSVGRCGGGGGRLGPRYSVFAATDISRCGVSEDDLLGSAYVRRNTCPNPFQYRAGAVRGLGRGARRGARRHSAAQTAVTALPPRWTSDTHLPHQPATRAAVSAHAARPRPPPPDPAARQLLSDIGFTSMVPELSRSADPVWALGRAPPAHAARYMSRAPPLRSPLNISVERSDERLFERCCERSVERCCERSGERMFERCRERSGERGGERGDWAHALYRPPLRDTYRGSLPDVRRRDDGDHHYDDHCDVARTPPPAADRSLRRSLDALPAHDPDDYEESEQGLRAPYLPTEARQLRLGHAVKVIAPHGRIAVGRVRYVGLAGPAGDAGVMVGLLVSGRAARALPPNDGTHRGRRYFHCPPRHTACFVPFGKVVMAWAG